ncbi:calcium-translocating P-type ATPase [Syntrophotalea carbinolica DSM 2380]|uniref:Calcium-translocating P-type ATPase n=1 Tax=Syntrophotalea carbinolica (strain DSM 2380 / NBRC 103641 / GraBd1) TaxID=338963 RepID=Q3A656_SYNC1|nr:cation-transporting P-type ATPase [Syntrophotalea carbinolica]ABA88151.1 calcium-translocating P-type ATPase [Syntrophotalea carbinolica DSM 2380]
MNDSLYPTHQSAAEVAKRQNTDLRKGLTAQQARRRLARYGRNLIARGKPISAWEIILRQVRNIIVVLLLTAAGISFFLGEILEGLAVLAVVVLNTLFGFITEYRAEKSVESLQQMVKTTAKVLRGGRLRQIAAEEVVAGDILVLEEGDLVTADGRLFEADNLAVDESLLTGESTPSGKTVEPIRGEVPLAECRNMVFMGTAVTRGNGAAVVVATGTATEVGKISDMLATTKEEPSPLEERLERTGRFLVVLTLAITAVVSGTGILGGRPWAEMLKTGIALAIAAVPEGLPAVATVTLAIGMWRMARHRALVKSLPAVETLGSTTVICTDKTGTLTENQMTLQDIALPDRHIRVEGTGYAPTGRFWEGEKPLDSAADETLRDFLRAGALCSNASLSETQGQWSLIGDPTEGALVTAACKAGLEREALTAAGWQRRDELPFDSDLRYMAVRCATPEKGEVIYLKGAPDVVLGMCRSIRQNSGEAPLDESLKASICRENSRLAAEGLRVLGLARKTSPPTGPLSETILSGMTFLGLAGILDPPRPDVADAIGMARAAGIRTIMLTGDQADTALAIARRVGIGSPDESVTSGLELAHMTVPELTARLRICSVYARISPRNKLDIIAALNADNQITAMTGDGVNDAPALKRADIGVAMGQRGTSVARQAADMVLLDDRFATILEAVRQGRVIFDNIHKFIHYLFSCNLSEILVIFLCILMGLPTPLVALQILWLNLVTDVFPALAMGFEAPETDVMTRPPRNPAQGLITTRFKLRIGAEGLFITLGPLVAFAVTVQQGLSLPQCRTVAFMTLAVGQLLHVFNVRRKNGLGFDASLSKAPYLWGAFSLTLVLQLLAVYTPALQRILHTTGLNRDMWIITLMGAAAPVLLMQLWAVMRRLRFSPAK